MIKCVRNNSGQSNVVAILSLIVAIITAGFTAFNYWQDYLRTKSQEEKLTQQVLDEVIDLLGGYEGTIWIDTSRASSREFTNIELAQRQIENEILVNRPDHVGALEMKACCLLKKGYLDDALDLLNMIIQNYPDRHTAYARRGNVLLHKRDFDRAISDFNMAIEKNFKFPDAYCLRGIAWHRKGEDTKALDDFNEALNKEPNHVHAYYNRGVLKLKQKDHDVAKSDFDKALNIYPLYHRAYSNRGMIWGIQGMYSKALSDFNRALDIKPHNSIYINNKAWLLATCPKGRYRNGALAVELAQKALEDGDNIYFMSTLAAAFAELGKFDDAIEAQEKTIKLLEKKGGTDILLNKFRERLNLYQNHLPYHEN